MREIFYSGLKLHILCRCIWQLHHLIRLNAHIMNGDTGGRIVFSDCNLHSGAGIQTIHRLHAALAEGFHTKEPTGLGVLDGSRHNLSSAGATMVH